MAKGRRGLVHGFHSVRAHLGGTEIHQRDQHRGEGTIFANYDGTNKSVTHLGDNVFIGSNSVLVAPVDIAAGAFVAAGSAVVEDIPAGSLAVARGRQHVSEGWVPKRRPASKAAASAANSEQGIHPDVAASREKVAARKPEEYK